VWKCKQLTQYEEPTNSVKYSNNTVLQKTLSKQWMLQGVCWEHKKICLDWGLLNLNRTLLNHKQLRTLNKAHAARNEQFQQVLSRLDGAEAKLRMLRRQPEQAQQSTVAPMQEMQTNDVQQEQAAPQTQQSAQPTADRHPRQAQADDAYSIENVFYCGQR
jgi:hypothetical protein